MVSLVVVKHQSSTPRASVEHGVTQSLPVLYSVANSAATSLIVCLYL